MADQTESIKTKASLLSQWLSRCLDSQYNWTLILATILIWAISGTLMMYSIAANFNMEIHLQEYIKLFSLLSIAIGFLKGCNSSNIVHVVALGITTYLISLLTIIMMRNLGLWHYIGVFILLPASIFMFFLQLKYLWRVFNILLVSRDDQ